MIDYSLILSVNFQGKQWAMSNVVDYSTLEWFDESNKPTQAELDALWIPTQEADSKAANKATASSLLAGTDWTTIADIGLPTANPRLSNQDQFIAYRQVIRQIAVYPPAGEVVWPTPPTEVWLQGE
jgi:hypothetical protein